MMKITTTVLLSGMILLSCKTISQNAVEQAGYLQMITCYTKSPIAGVPVCDTTQVWYSDSCVIQHIRSTVSESDKNGTRVWHRSIMYRYIILHNRSIYDYKNFSDTAAIINKAPLPDTMMRDDGWSFYSDKIPLIKGEPEVLNDTVIDGISYRRMKLDFEHDQPRRLHSIGYFRCDGKDLLFSLEKTFSKKIGCTLSMFTAYRSNETLFATRRINYIRNTLTEEEQKVFAAWKKNALENSVK